ncbi:MAG TPA: outer membrane protein assembly factor BamD [Acidocella sp.]|jgi:outer membrane protein assembly factor BamD|nr:outer membrane protein assembly factor BamD [Acidocella sp.]
MTKFSSGLTRTALLSLALGLGGCSSFLNSATKEGDFPQGSVPPPDQAYATAVHALDKGDDERAAKDFEVVEENYPYSTWSTHAELLVGYAQYKNMDYDDAISSLNHFIQLHPENEETAYAYYLKALCYYEQIDDVQRDQTATYEAISALNDVIGRYPETAYAHDARIKLRLANDRLAGHDMVIGRFYQKQHLYGAAVGRYQDVAANFQQTTYVPEALERLVEVYLDLGLPDEAVRAASVLGYNYPGNAWYQTAYNKLQDHGLTNLAEQVQAANGSEAPPPRPLQTHHWFWPF